MGPCTASSCCCQARNLPWAPVPPPHAAARPVNLPWAPVPPPHAAARSRVCHGSLYGSHCCCLHRHTLPCATFRSPHTAGGFHFVIGCCMAPIAAASTATLWLHTLVLARDCPNECEVCGDSKIDGTHLHVILTDSIISLPQQTPRAFKLKVTVFCTNI
ncbi:unnamed protein product, partial [Staurois parvus]